jgi:hypothetical protein
MPVINVSTVSGGSGSAASPFTAIASAGLTVTAGNWGQTTPTSLTNVTDNDLTTATGYGQTAGYGNKGFILVDLGQVYEHLYFETKIGFKMGSGWGGGDAAWAVELADENGNYTPLWNVTKFKPGETEFLLRRGFWASGQKVKFTAEDTGNGPAMLRVYHLKCWSVTLP